MKKISGIIDKEILDEFCKKYHIRKLSLFGSVLTDDFKPGSSDIDMLVEFDREQIPDLFKFSGMELEISELLGYRIDLRTKGDLSRFFRDDVVQKAELIYEQ
jgi:uncharacterized protein